jgi:hypothetical protein
LLHSLSLLLEKFCQPTYLAHCMQQQCIFKHVCRAQKLWQNTLNVCINLLVCKSTWTKHCIFCADRHAGSVLSSLDACMGLH